MASNKKITRYAKKQKNTTHNEKTINKEKLTGM